MINVCSLKPTKEVRFLQPYRSLLAEMLRERHRLRAMLRLHPVKRDLIEQRLEELETLIKRHEDLGSRSYLEHIMNRACFTPDARAQTS